MARPKAVFSRRYMFKEIVQHKLARVSGEGVP